MNSGSREEKFRLQLYSEAMASQDADITPAFRQRCHKTCNWILSAMLYSSAKQHWTVLQKKYATNKVLNVTAVSQKTKVEVSGFTYRVEFSLFISVNVNSWAICTNKLQQLMVTLHEVTISLLQGVFITEVKGEYRIWCYTQCRLA